ncbi:hypothetical protein ACFP2F_16330 [Hymenobacter artigasi]|uniref:Uncharacterized protein n=1 Tax=Hymenobacter artigasi TaxID=2719616 RepID=A0ABX1HP16_9BACT|nr:hypothetical protein [Hymenobacter artigasi]NKI91649.1 hypothetical protein [Hymenobacter artigasi]
MKASLFSIIAAVALFTSTASFAAAGPFDHRYDDRNSRDFNYGYDRNHRVTDYERARWEAAHRDNKGDRRDAKNDIREAKADLREAKGDLRDARHDAKDDRNDKNFNYGYDRNHRVSPQERARWEAAHRYDGRR